MQAFYQDVVHLQVAFGHDLLYFKHLELMILGLRIVLRTCTVFIGFKYVQVGRVLVIQKMWTWASTSNKLMMLQRSL